MALDCSQHEQCVETWLRTRDGRSAQFRRASQIPGLRESLRLLHQLVGRLESVSHDAKLARSTRKRPCTPPDGEALARGRAALAGKIAEIG
jgi:hypothetical protein